MGAGHVSHGKGPLDIVGEQINTVDFGSRVRNNLARGTNQHTGTILFAQILIPIHMRARFMEESTCIFTHASALRGSAQTRASDHLPAFADFIFGPTEPPPPVAAVHILSVLPNSDAPDEGREEVRLRNGTAEAVDLAGWMLRDRVYNRIGLAGLVPAQQ
ncbi:MAG TPA: hypothetical protein VLK82_08060 [Candidatus Tectomicrobia bacterium]|nr:hypothetical protein [Candidatus Tectomicrobia bacterium]